MVGFSCASVLLFLLEERSPQKFLSRWDQKIKGENTSHQLHIPKYKLHTAYLPSTYIRQTDIRYSIRYMNKFTLTVHMWSMHTMSVYRVEQSNLKSLILTPWKVTFIFEVLNRPTGKKKRRNIHNSLEHTNPEPTEMIYRLLRHHETWLLNSPLLVMW